MKIVIGSSMEHMYQNIKKIFQRNKIGHANMSKNKIDNLNHHESNNTDNDTNSDNNALNRTLIVGPSYCGKTYLLLNKLKLIKLMNNNKNTRHN